jgi:CelD/BcsL family acetyltransferase involved in cellulose biosynthesis
MFLKLVSDEQRIRSYQGAKTRQNSMAVNLIRPDELGPAEIATWHSMQQATPSLADPFLSPEFAVAVGRFRPNAHVAVLAEGQCVTGFFPFERRRFGVGVPIGGWQSLSQALIHAVGAEWNPRELLRGCRLAAWEFDCLILDQQPFEPYHAATVAVPIIDISDGFAAYYAKLQARSPRFLRELDRKTRKFAREVGKICIVADSRDINMLRMLMAWKSDQYRRTGHVDTFGRPWLVGLLYDLLDIRSDYMSGTLSVLYAGDQPVAVQFGLRAGNILHGWFTAYDTRFKKYSPGLVLIKKMAEEFASAGFHRIYMGRGRSIYKESMKSNDVFVAEGIVTSQSMLGVTYRIRSSSVRRVADTVRRHPNLHNGARRISRLAHHTHGRI